MMITVITWRQSAAQFILQYDLKAGTRPRYFHRAQQGTTFVDIDFRSIYRSAPIASVDGLRIDRRVAMAGAN